MSRKKASVNTGGLLDLTYRGIADKRGAKDARFKTISAGNARARSNASATWAALFAAELSRSISVAIDGKKTKLTVLDAILDKLAARALAGSIPHMNLLLRNEYRELSEPAIIRLSGDLAKL